MNDTLINSYVSNSRFEAREEDFFIRNVNENDAGKITCVASNGIGKNPSVSTKLIVQCK